MEASGFALLGANFYGTIAPMLEHAAAFPRF